MSLGAQLAITLWLLAAPLWIPLVLGGAAIAALWVLTKVRAALLATATAFLNLAERHLAYWTHQRRPRPRWIILQAYLRAAQWLYDRSEGLAPAQKGIEPLLARTLRAIGYPIP